MLVLSRKKGERIRVADNVVIVVTEIKGNRVKIGVEAPQSYQVLRGELLINNCAADAPAAVVQSNSH